MSIVVRNNISSKLKISTSEIGYYSYTNRYLQAKKMNRESEEIEFEREISKIGLETFVDNLKENSFSNTVFEQTEKLQKELNETVTEFLKAQEKSDQDEYYFQLDTIFLEDKLSALSEMNIVYAYKEFEINLKKLIGAAYGMDTREFYKWESIISFLKSKNIKPSELNGFQEINDLRKVNNHIKHSNSHEINDKIKSIAEFRELKYLRHYELTDFFNRIKNFSYTFLYSISTEIYMNLYEFDSNRLKQIARLFAVRMDKNTAELFVKKIKKLY